MEHKKRIVINNNQNRSNKAISEIGAYQKSPRKDLIGYIDPVMS